MRKQKHYVYLNEQETRVLLKSLIRFKNILAQQGRYTDVIGMEQEDATRLLVDCGLQFQVWRTDENNSSSKCYYIIDQSIPEGATVPAGTLICLELSISPY